MESLRADGLTANAGLYAKLLLAVGEAATITADSEQDKKVLAIWRVSNTHH